MITSQSTVITLDNTNLIAPTGLTVELTQEVNELTPVPGTAYSDGWRRYSTGRLRWSLSSTNLVTENSSTYLRTIMQSGSDTLHTARITFGTSFRLDGSVRASSFAITAPRGHLASISMSFACDGFPTYTAL